MALEHTRVIPAGWEAHHAPVSEDAMTATAVFTRGGTGVFSETLRRTVYAAAAMVWSGPVRVTPSSGSFGRNEPVVGDQAKPIRVFEIEMPLSAPRILIGDFGEIADATDSDFVTRTFQVVSYPGGSLVWDRNLICHEAQPQGR